MGLQNASRLSQQKGQNHVFFKNKAIRPKKVMVRGMYLSCGPIKVVHNVLNKIKIKGATLSIVTLAFNKEHTDMFMRLIMWNS